MTQLVGQRVRNRERGAVMPIFAALVVGGLTFGMLALAVDVGNVWHERRELQNAADATALSLARECAEAGANAALCVSANSEVASLLNPNVGSGAAQFAAETADAYAPYGACERLDMGPLPECLELSDAAFGDLSECPPLPDWLTGAGAGIDYVETYARTQSGEADSTVLPGFFSGLVLGGGSDMRVIACARAAWGPPGPRSDSVPIVISACEWQDQTSGGTNYVSEPPAGVPGYGGAGQPAWPTGREVEIILHNPNDEASDCDWNGKDTAGGFGFVQENDCSAEVSDDGWVPIDTGNDVPQDCQDFVDGLAGTVISIPVFNCLLAVHPTDPDPSGPAPTEPEGICDPTRPDMAGNNGWYHIDGWAKFYVSGYSLSGHSEPSVMPGGLTSCTTAGARCLYGWFLQGHLDSDAIDPNGGSDFGTYTILPAG